MKYKIIHNSYVIDFIEHGFHEDLINQSLQSVIEENLNSSKNLDELKDWTLQISIIYNNTDDLVICRKNKSSTAYKYKEVVIHVPIPTKKIVAWGVEDKQLISTKWDYRNSKFVEIFNINPSNYVDRDPYIIDALSLAINQIFKLGVTVNGKKVIVKGGVVGHCCPTVWDK